MPHIYLIYLYSISNLGPNDNLSTLNYGMDIMQDMQRSFIMIWKSVSNGPNPMQLIKSCLIKEKNVFFKITRFLDHSSLKILAVLDRSGIFAHLAHIICTDKQDIQCLPWLMSQGVKTATLNSKMHQNNNSIKNVKAKILTIYKTMFTTSTLVSSNNPIQVRRKSHINSVN